MILSPCIGTCDLVLWWDIVPRKPNTGAALNWKILSTCIETHELVLGCDVGQTKPNTGATLNSKMSPHFIGKSTESNTGNTLYLMIFFQQLMEHFDLEWCRICFHLVLALTYRAFANSRITINLYWKKRMTDTLYWKMLRRPIQGMPRFWGRKLVENVPKIADTGYFRFLHVYRYTGSRQ